MIKSLISVLSMSFKDIANEVFLFMKQFPPAFLKRNFEEAAHDSCMNPEPGFQSGPGDSTDAD